MTSNTVTELMNHSATLDFNNNLIQCRIDGSNFIFIHLAPLFDLVGHLGRLSYADYAHMTILQY